jgi:hypothetical protein
VVLASCTTCAALNATVVEINQTVSGNTTSSPRNLYTPFVDDSVGKAGQVLYSLTMGDSSNVDMVLSTCAQSDFATYLVVFNGTDLQQDANIAESGHDPTCPLAEPRAGLTCRASPGASYTILVTGAGEQEGAYTLVISSLEPQPMPLSWGLDRIDQRYPPLDNRYRVTQVAPRKPLLIYILDSGVRRTHVELQGRVETGYDATRKSSPTTDDCTGSGTSVASIVAGETVGVARSAHVVPVRILDCKNEGTISTVLNAIEWVLISYLSLPTGIAPSVILMRFTTNKSTILDRAIQGAIGYGIPVIIPAGDDGSGGFCDSASPADSELALVVGSAGSDDTRSLFSNFGSCVGLYAPGKEVLSASHVSDTAYYNKSGTAQSAAYVAGVAALLMNLNPGITPSQVTTTLKTLATRIVRSAANDTAAYATSGLVFVRSVPAIAKSRPAAGSILIYFIVRLTALQNSATKTCASEIAKTRMAKVLNINAQLFTTECYSPATGPTTSAAFLFRLLESESRSPGTFQKIGQALSLDSKTTERELGSPLEVLEPVWFLDSNGIIFWGEPQVGAVASEGLSPSVMAGIVIGAVLLFIILIAISFAFYRFVAKKDEVQPMEGSGDVEASPPQFDDFAKTISPGNVSPTLHGRSFRNVFEGLGRSMSARKVTRQKYNGDNSNENNRARMDSFADIFGDKALEALEDTRMQSYGGEAFVGFGRVSHSPHQVTEQSPRRSSALFSNLGKGGLQVGHEEHRIVSFRGRGNVTSVTRKSVYSDEEGLSSVGDLRLHSIDGEAFSALGGESSTRNSKSAAAFLRQPAISMDSTSQRNRSNPSAEALAPVTGKSDGRKSSFFHDQHQKPSR